MIVLYNTASVRLMIKRTLAVLYIGLTLIHTQIREPLELCLTYTKPLNKSV